MNNTKNPPKGEAIKAWNTRTREEVLEMALRDAAFDALCDESLSHIPSDPEVQEAVDHYISKAKSEVEDE